MERPGSATGNTPVQRVRFKASRDLPRAAEGLESPDDTDARYRHKRHIQWTGSMVHVSETCEPPAPRVLTHVHTTTAAIHEARCTAPIPALVIITVTPVESLADRMGSR